jgi:hypothetical protein
MCERGIHVAIEFRAKRAVRSGMSYILVHQASLAYPAVAEDDDLDSRVREVE